MGTLISRFNRRLNIADLAGGIAVAVFIGYERQRLADSGELITEKVIVSILIAGGAYLIAFLITRFKKFESTKVPQWTSMALLGAVLCSLSLHVVYYLIENRRYQPDQSMLQYVWFSLPDLGMSFVGTSIIYCALTLSILALVRICLMPRLVTRGG
jgi:hypothetical protein